jgi:hypothetical protein
MPKTTKQLPQSTLFWVLATAIPLTTVLSTHLWLRSAYSTGIFNREGFLRQFGTGIFRYRVLGRYAVLFVYHLLMRTFHDTPLTMPRDPNATTLFYFSYVVVDAVCFAASNFLLLLILSDRQRRLKDMNLATYFYLTLMQACAMAVVSPYDQISYLFILISLIAATLPKSWIAYTLLGIAAIAGTLTRETQLVATSALFSLALFSTGDRARRFWTAGACNLGLFSLIYVGLRILIKGPKVVSGVWTFGGTWAPESLVVLAMLFFVSTALAFRMRAELRPTIALLVFGLPYILTILMSGVLRELRLLVPILLAQAFIYAQLQADSEPASRRFDKLSEDASIDTAESGAASGSIKSISLIS